MFISTTARIPVETPINNGSIFLVVNVTPVKISESKNYIHQTLNCIIPAVVCRTSFTKKLKKKYENNLFISRIDGFNGLKSADRKGFVTSKRIDLQHVQQLYQQGIKKTGFC
jgi:hypothetical protein